MDDPESFDHVETGYRNMGDHMYVEMSFRGKNKFGALVRNTVTAKVSWNCEVLDVNN